MSALVWQGVATMTPERYAVLASLVGPWLEEYRDSPIWIGEDSGNERRAIYIPVNGEGVACYCGRTRPERALCGGAASVRIRQHMTESRSKREEWSAYWVLPLRADTPAVVVSELERTVAARLGVPLVNRRWRRH
ncbi:hypothetical protein OHT61_00150 [Streptomyces sp. NBC_00178]|uniref:hypothetical protein n=1 Tax=Streptomyces sp. NBC_00178 TaxID=2975672 RepID=UPI002E2BF706|nr:hypothetical protein [Streptomyces sp. NBC_00178]